MLTAQEVVVDKAHAPHAPVMAARVVELLAAPSGAPGLVIDATVGAGGHAVALLAASDPATRLVGLDRDPDALELAERRLEPFADRVTLVHEGYDRLAELVATLDDPGPVVAVLYDLGVSSMQLDRPERGFSFRSDAPLDMRMDPGSEPSAEHLVNTLAADDLAGLIFRYGEERHARRIARAIVAARPIATTGRLADVVAGAVPAPSRHGGPHPATRTFQALRIAVNAELERFSASLPQALELAAPRPVGASRGGRVAVLSYHSLEDRIAKQTFAKAARGCVCPPDLPVCVCGRQPSVHVVTRGAERPDASEIAGNPRARAAKLRVAEKLSDQAPGTEELER